MRIVFFGTSQFAQTILEYLISQGSEIAAVVTRPDKPKGRSGTPVPTPVKASALAHHLHVYQPLKASAPEFAAFLKTLNADVFVVAAYAEILKQNVLDIPHQGCINVHGSILPKYRGAAPVPRAIMEGEAETGVTIMKMALQMDAGDILAICKMAIPLEMTAGELMDALADLGKKALWEVLQNLERIEPIKQDPALSSHAAKIRPEDAQVNWDRPCLAVHNQIRGVTPNPGAWCWVEVKGEKKRLLIKKSLPVPSVSGNPGQIVSRTPLEMVVGCGSGSLALTVIQLEGKKALAIEEFLRGISLSQIKFT
ncbi:methionyl-tRNA formyltransferase [Chlamydiota bacterium]